MWDIICTSIGSSALVAVGPREYISSNAISILQKHTTYYWDMAENKPFLPPHIFQLANNAYYYMCCTAQHQSLIVRCVLFLLDVVSEC